MRKINVEFYQFKACFDECIEREKRRKRKMRELRVGVAGKPNKK